MINSKFLTEDLFVALHKIKKPVDFKFDLNELPNSLLLVVYEDEVMRFNDYQRKLIMEYLLELRQTCYNYKVDCKIAPKKGLFPL